MKIIGTFLTVCGLMAAQAPQAPNPAQQSTENAARMAAGDDAHLSRHRDSANRQGNQLPAPQRCDEDRLPRH